jgi:hypothetical protein
MYIALTQNENMCMYVFYLYPYLFILTLYYDAFCCSNCSVEGIDKDMEKSSVDGSYLPFMSYTHRDDKNKEAV